MHICLFVMNEAPSEVIRPIHMSSASTEERIKAHIKALCHQTALIELT